MYIIEFKNPYTNKIEQHKIKGKNRSNVESMAWAKAEKMWKNHWCDIEIFCYEKYNGKKTGRGFRFKKRYSEMPHLL